MFRERLTEISERIGGTLALSLVARDGIPVESVSTDSEIDLEMLAAELIAQVRTMSDDHRDLNVGEVKQLAVTTDRLTLMISAISDDYYLLLVLGDPANHGRARFELRRARLLLEGDLV